MNDTMPPIPVFIGNFRSGTTLLANLLGFHEQISPWFETKGLCELLRWQRVLKDPINGSFESSLIQPKDPIGFDADVVSFRFESDLRETLDRISGAKMSGKGSHESYPVGHDRLLYGLEEALDLLSQWRSVVGKCQSHEVLAKANGDLIKGLGMLHLGYDQKLFWVNKTPEITRFGEELESALGPTKRILMLRDGRDVIQSASKLGWADPAEIGAWWKGMILESRGGGSTSKDLYLEIRYEDLLKDPVGGLNQVLHFLEVEERGLEMVEQYRQFVGLSDKPPRSLSEDGRNQFLPFLDVAFLEQLGYPI